MAIVDRAWCNKGRTPRSSFGIAFAVLAVLAAAGCASDVEEELMGTSESTLANGSAIVGLGKKCLDVKGGSTANNAKVQLYECNGTLAQKWTFENGSLKTGAGKCLDVVGASSASGTAVQQYDCHNGKNQKWKLQGNRIVGLDGKCLDVDGEAVDGAKVQIWDCHDGPNQKWTVGGGGSPSGGGSPGASGGNKGPSGGGAGVVFEDFNGGFGLLDHPWDTGNAKAYVVNGIAKIDGTKSGAGLMMWPKGKDKCFGNGLFEIRSKLKGKDVGDNSGPANVLWPASDKWPGPEVDIGEIDTKGRVYMATHWKDANGKDDYDPFYAPAGFDQWQFHTYAAFLQTDKITYMIDGVVIGVDTKHPAPDFAHGGENHCIGIMNRSSQTGIEAEWVRWTPESSVK